jgi:hypothetical protein
MTVALTMLGVSELLAFGLTCRVLFHPGTGYRQARRSTVLWLLAGIVASVLPLGYVFLSAVDNSGKADVGLTRRIAMPGGSADTSGRPCRVHCRPSY